MVVAYFIDPSDEYSILIPAPACLNGRALLPVDEKPRLPALAGWTPCEYYVAREERRRGDFFYVGSGNFACGGRVLEQVRPCLELDCELLPITIQGLSDDEYFLIHPITMVQALPPPPRPYSAIEAIKTLNAPPYLRSAFDRSMIFRDNRHASQSACISGLEPKERDFWLQYQERQLNGLNLKKVWEHP